MMPSSVRKRRPCAKHAPPESLPVSPTNHQNRGRGRLPGAVRSVISKQEIQGAVYHIVGCGATRTCARPRAHAHAHMPTPRRTRPRPRPRPRSRPRLRAHAHAMRMPNSLENATRHTKSFEVAHVIRCRAAPPRFHLPARPPVRGSRLSTTPTPTHCESRARGGTRACARGTVP